MQTHRRPVLPRICRAVKLVNWLFNCHVCFDWIVTSSTVAEKETSAPSASLLFGKPASLKWKNKRASRSAHLQRY